MSLTDQRPALLAETDAHEGPVYVAAEDALYYTTLPGQRDAAGRPVVAIERLTVATGEVSVVRAEANAANGMTLAHDGWLVVCEQGALDRPAQLTRVDPRSGRVETLVDRWRGLPLNSPNDVVVRRDGSVWFTDPSYGHLQGFRPEPVLGDDVYRYDPATGELDVVEDSFDKPNGLAFSPDERVLYVGDSGANQTIGSYDPARPHHVRAFDVVDGRRLTNGRLFATIAPGFPDGIKVDADGRVYVSCARGIQVFTPHGVLIDEIDLPGAVNFTFGGNDGHVLLITADHAIHAIRVAASGL